MFGFKRNIALFYAVYFLQGLVFYSPVATLYRQAAGLNLLQISLIESISLGLMFVLEIPWGWLADRLGYRRTIVICSGLFAVSKVIFWQADGFFAFLTERVVLSVCLSGLSGCDSAFLYASCPPGEHRKVFSRWEAVQTAGMLIASLSWPLLGGSYRLAALLTVGSYTAAALLTLGLQDTGGHKDNEDAPPPLTLSCALRRTLHMAPYLIALCLFQETVQMVTVFLSQPQAIRAGIDETFLGSIHAAVTLAGLAGIWSHRVSERLGTRRAGGLFIGTAAAACLLLALCPWPAATVLGVVLLKAGGSLMAPLALAVQNEQAGPAGQATQLSCNAMLMNLGSICLYPAFGALSDTGVEGGLLLGAVCCAIALVLFLLDRGKGS